jgi:hypothetical protein
MLQPCSSDLADATVTKELWETTVKWLPCSVTILKLPTLTFIGVVGLLPTQASAQFSLPIPIPPFYLRPPGYHSAPSHHSSSRIRHEERNGSSTEKDAAQEGLNTGPSAEHQQQVSAPTSDATSSPPRSTPSQNKPDDPPLFVPLR